VRLEPRRREERQERRDKERCKLAHLASWRLRLRIIILLIARETRQVLLPFHWNEILFLVVALLTAGHDIPFEALSSSAQGNDVIHGEIFDAYFLTAVIADPLADLSHPPRRLPQVPRFFLLFSYGLLAGNDQFRTARSRFVPPPVSCFLSSPVLHDAPGLLI